MRRLKILCFLQPGNVSRAFFADMITGLRAAGHTCLVTELAPIWKQFEQNPARRPAIMSAATAQITAILHREQIDLSIGMWANVLSTLAHGQRAGRGFSCFELLEPPHPHLQYWLDAPHWAQNGSVRTMFPIGVLRSRWLLNVVNNEAIAEEMRRVLGFAHALGLPYGINDLVFKPPDAPTPMRDREFDIACTLGPGGSAPTPLMLEQLERDQPDTQAIRSEAAWRVAPMLDQLADRAPPAARPGLRRLFADLLGTQLESRHAPMLQRLDALTLRESSPHGDAAAALLADPALWIDVSAAIREIENWERAFTFVYLAKRFRCLLFGQCDLGAWGCPIKSTGFCAHEQQPAAYARARLGLSVMRWQDDQGVNLKPLEIGASGCVPLVARREGLSALLQPETEVEVFEGPAEATERARRLLADPARIETMSQSCMARIARDHTWKTRGDTMLAKLGEWTGRW